MSEMVLNTEWRAVLVAAGLFSIQVGFLLGLFSAWGSVGHLCLRVDFPALRPSTQKSKGTLEVHETTPIPSAQYSRPATLEQPSADEVGGADEHLTASFDAFDRTCLVNEYNKLGQPTFVSKVIYRNLTKVLRTIETAQLSTLKDPVLIRDLVRQIGLMPHGGKITSGLMNAGNSLYGEEAAYRLPSTVFGVGVTYENGMWQIPQQFACAMTKLWPKRIQHSLTTGTFSGWTDTFISAYLRRFAPIPDAYTHTTFDVIPYVTKCIAILHNALNVTRYVYGSPILKNPLRGEKPTSCKTTEASGVGCTLQETLPILREHYDLCFIDGDHSFTAVQKDFEALAGRCTIYMFHDIINNRATGVAQFWKKMRESNYLHDEYMYEIEECLYQPTSSDHRMMGIGFATLLTDHAPLAKSGPI